MVAVAEIDDRITKCQKILDTDPNSQIFAALAEAYRKNGELDRAFRVCQNGLKIHPSYGSAHVVMAKINLDRGLYDWAEAEVEKAVEVDGGSRAIDLLMSEIHIYKGEFEDAVRLLKSLHRSDSGNQQIKKLLEIAIRIPEEQQTITEIPVPEDHQLIEEEPALEEEPAPVELTTSDIVRQVMQVPEIKGAMFLNRDGLVVESDWGVDLEPEICGTTLGEASRYVDRELARKPFGKVSTVLIETNSLMYNLVNVANGTFLFVGTSSLNLGTLRMKLESLFDKYQA
jgi:predicted regulator of Ras-like GTPase activity (Roadblock/LC7/MglB family)